METALAFDVVLTQAWQSSTDYESDVLTTVPPRPSLLYIFSQYLCPNDLVCSDLLFQGLSLLCLPIPSIWIVISGFITAVPAYTVYLICYFRVYHCCACLYRVSCLDIGWPGYHGKSCILLHRLSFTIYGGGGGGEAKVYINNLSFWATGLFKNSFIL